jgi:Fur family transcriptional regulator, peroxide stress response regulator
MGTNKYRQTRQRELILFLLQGTKAHPTAEWVYKEARKSIPNISKGTVYRNLAILAGMGEISELNLSGTITRYEVKQSQHDHFRCEKCGHVFDIHEPLTPQLDEDIAQKTGHMIKYHQLEFRGLCKDCRQTGEKG